MEWGKIIAVFISCAIKPGLAGIPTAVFAFKFTFLQTLIISSSGGITGTLIFSYLIDGIFKMITRFQDKHFPNRNRNKKIFTKTNRIIVKAKRSFGIVGISIISPPFLSIPFGVFLALRFFGHRGKIILCMCISVVVWTILLYFFYHSFYASFVSMFS
ncbi:MAG: hypothetical protein ACJ76F_11110 [Bacteroidia bacterium]